MSQLFSKMFKSGSQSDLNLHRKSKTLPADYAQQILNNDIILVLSDYTNNDALKNLIQLYMMGVEHYKEIEDRAHEYFTIKLKNIFTNPTVLQQPTPPIKKEQQNKIELPLQTTPTVPNYSFMHKPLTAGKVKESNFLSFSFQEPSVDKFFQGQQAKQNHNHSQLIDKDSESTHSKDDKEHKCKDYTPEKEEHNSQKQEKLEQIEQAITEEIFVQNPASLVKEMAHQYRKENRRISQQIAQNMDQQSNNIKMRMERRLRNQVSMHNINKTQSTPTIKQVEIQQQPQLSIPEENNEIGSSKVNSTQKQVEINQFSFNEEQ